MNRVRNLFEVSLPPLRDTSGGQEWTGLTIGNYTTLSLENGGWQCLRFIKTLVALCATGGEEEAVAQRDLARGIQMTKGLKVG